MAIAAYRSGCPLDGCGLILSAASPDALKQAHIEHLTAHLTDYCEREVEAGRMVRVERDGKTLYREVAKADR